mgnify:CR=1 FL=1
MTAEEFTVQIMDMKKTLYHVSCGILRSEADREDAVQEKVPSWAMKLILDEKEWDRQQL